jgi:anti-sigma factor RsiW
MLGENRGDAVEPTHDLNLSTQPDPVPDPVPDPDFELLENYLDGELTPGEVQRLEQRLVLEPELSAALGRMSAEHAVRQAVWQSMEPGEAAARSLAAAVGASARRSNLRRLVMKFARVSGAVAACVVLFLAGFGVGRGKAAPDNSTGGDEVPVMNRSATRPSSSADAAAYFYTAGKHAHPQPPAAPAGAEPVTVFQVALTDEAGNITAVQKFDNLKEAQNFAAEVELWQARQQQIQSGKVVVKTSRF